MCSVWGLVVMIASFDNFLDRVLVWMVLRCLEWKMLVLHPLVRWRDGLAFRFLDCGLILAYVTYCHYQYSDGFVFFNMKMALRLDGVRDTVFVILL